MWWLEWSHVWERPSYIIAARIAKELLGDIAKGFAKRIA